MYAHIYTRTYIYTHIRRGHLEDLATSAVGPIDLGGQMCPTTQAGTTLIWSLKCNPGGP